MQSFEGPNFSTWGRYYSFSIMRYTKIRIMVSTFLSSFFGEWVEIPIDSAMKRGPDRKDSHHSELAMWGFLGFTWRGRSLTCVTCNDNWWKISNNRNEMWNVYIHWSSNITYLSRFNWCVNLDYAKSRGRSKIFVKVKSNFVDWKG